MNPADEVITWAGMWLTLLAIAVGIGVHLLIQIGRRSWKETSARIDRDLAEMVNGGTPRQATNCDLGYHNGPWSRYANYGIWLCCGTRQDQPYRTPYHCAAKGCSYVRDATGYWCPECGHAIASDTPYDVDLDGTDLGQWNKEMDAS